MPDRPFILPLTDDPAFIALRPGDNPDEETLLKVFPGIDRGLKMLAEAFFADPANQSVEPKDAA